MVASPTFSRIRAWRRSVPSPPGSLLFEEISLTNLDDTQSKSLANYNSKYAPVAMVEESLQ